MKNVTKASYFPKEYSGSVTICNFTYELEKSIETVICSDGKV